MVKLHKKPETKSLKQNQKPETKDLKERAVRRKNGENVESEKPEWREKIERISLWKDLVAKRKEREWLKTTRNWKLLKFNVQLRSERQLGKEKVRTMLSGKLSSLMDNYFLIFLILKSLKSSCSSYC